MKRNEPKTSLDHTKPHTANKSLFRVQNPQRKTLKTIQTPIQNLHQNSKQKHTKDQAKIDKSTKNI